MQRTSALVVALLLTTACEGGAAVGALCARASDCGSGTACRLGACRVECAESRDCPLGSECVPVAGGAVCTLSTERCTSDTECPMPLVCGADGTCRATCLRDADCTSDGSCVLAGRLTCVARTPVDPPACLGAVNPGFVSGLSGWCVETSSGVEPSVVSTSAAGFDGAAVEIDLENVAIGGWARLTQEAAFDPTETLIFDTLPGDLTGGTQLAAIELLDASGTVLGRIAQAYAGRGESACDETGRPGLCFATSTAAGNLAFQVGAAADVGYLDVDLRAIARVRRVFEVARTGNGTVRAVLDNGGTLTPACPLAWWRSTPHRALLDLDDPLHLPPGASLAPDAPIRFFVAGTCGRALALDGTGWIDWRGPFAPGATTITLAWHGTRYATDMEGTVLVRELDGDLDVRVRDGRWEARAGTCRAVDPRPITPSDRRMQELQVMLDRSTDELCLAREGVLIACDTTGTCDAGASTATGLRFGEGAPTDDVMGIDEIRIDDGSLVPDETARTGHCHLDTFCANGERRGVRDVGSGECREPEACADIRLCPAAARDAAVRCSAEATPVPCGADLGCTFGVVICDGAATPTCPGSYLQCDESVVASCR